MVQRRTNETFYIFAYLYRNYVVLHLSEYYVCMHFLICLKKLRNRQLAIKFVRDSESESHFSYMTEELRIFCVSAMLMSHVQEFRCSRNVI